MEEFIKLSSDGNLKLQFTNQPRSKFWTSVQNEYHSLAREALKKLLPFATTYYVKQGFHTMCQQKISTKADWMPRRICIFSCLITHSILRAFPLLCKLILQIKNVKFVGIIFKIYFFTVVLYESNCGSLLTTCKIEIHFFLTSLCQQIF